MVRRISAWVVGLLLTALYAYAVVAAAGNLIGMRAYGAALGTGLSASGWAWLIIGIALPVIVLGIALLVARGRGAGARLLLLATGLAVVAVLQLDMTHLITESSYFV